MWAIIPECQVSLPLRIVFVLAQRTFPGLQSDRHAAAPGFAAVKWSSSRVCSYWSNSSKVKNLGQWLSAGISHSSVPETCFHAFWTTHINLYIGTDPSKATFVLPCASSITFQALQEAHLRRCWTVLECGWSWARQTAHAGVIELNFKAELQLGWALSRPSGQRCSLISLDKVNCCTFFLLFNFSFAFHDL